MQRLRAVPREKAGIVRDDGLLRRSSRENRRSPPKQVPFCGCKKAAASDAACGGLVGESGFEPLKSSTTDLQSAPFDRSGTPPDAIWKGWSWWTDSNPRPADYKSAALPAELHQQDTVSNSRAYLTRYTPVCQQIFCRPLAVHSSKKKPGGGRRAFPRGKKTPAKQRRFAGVRGSVWRF